MADRVFPLKPSARIKVVLSPVHVHLHRGFVDPAQKSELWSAPESSSLSGDSGNSIDDDKTGKDRRSKGEEISYVL
jgi:hypothetical protein